MPDTETAKISGALLAAQWLASLVERSPGRAAFVGWALTSHPEEWRKWAEGEGLDEEDGRLAQNAVIALDELTKYATRLLLDQLAASVETREIAEGRPGAG